MRHIRIFGSRRIIFFQTISAVPSAKPLADLTGPTGITVELSRVCSALCPDEELGESTLS